MTKRERNELICTQYKEGYSQEKIGKFYNLSQSRVSEILLEKKRGIPKIIKETRGAKARLNEKQLSELSELLKRSKKEKDGFPYWNKWSIKQLIKDTFDVDYHENYIWKLMDKIGFTSQRPQTKDYRQCEEKLDTFKKQTAPSIKKSKRGKEINRLSR